MNIVRSWRRAIGAVSQSLRHETRDYTRLPLKRALVLLAIPMMAEMVMESVFAVVDIFFVSRLGPDAIAAVGLTEAMMTLVIAVSIGVAMAATAMVARRVGEGDFSGATVAAVNVLWLGVAVSAIVGMVGWFFAPDLLGLMGASESVVDIGVGYTRAVSAGSLSLIYLFLINAIFRGAGNAAIAMRVLWIANGINIVLDPLLIFGIGPFPEMGVTGAGVATVIGRGCGALLGLWWLFGGVGRVRLQGARLIPTWPIVRRLCSLSAGGVGQFLIATSSWIILISLVARFGSAAVAGYTIGLRIILFVILPSWGLGNAAASLVGQYLGASRPDMANAAAWLAARFNTLFLTVVAIVLWAGAPTFVAWFTDDLETAGHAIAFLRILTLAFPTWALGMVLTQSLNGAGDTRTPTLINFIALWIVQLSLAWWLTQYGDLGATGAYWSVAVADMVLAVLAVWAFRRGVWKLKEV